MTWGSESVECRFSSANETASPFTGRSSGRKEYISEKIGTIYTSAVQPFTFFRPDHHNAQHRGVRFQRRTHLQRSRSKRPRMAVPECRMPRAGPASCKPFKLHRKEKASPRDCQFQKRSGFFFSCAVHVLDMHMT